MAEKSIQERLQAKGRALIAPYLKTEDELQEMAGWWPWKKADSKDAE